ncbi:unnamed protein product, partial [Prorocentrum cordatum]
SSDGAGASGWEYDPHPTGGWRWCPITLEQCWARCIARGGCVSVYFTRGLSGDCCFPSRAACSGSDHPGTTAVGTTYTLRAAAPTQGASRSGEQDLLGSGGGDTGDAGGVGEAPGPREASGEGGPEGQRIEEGNNT